MTHEFKPGDKVSLPRHIRTVKTVEHHNSVGLRLLYFVDGGCGLVDNYELVEPVVTHGQLRKVLTESKHAESSARTRRLISRIYETLTGEVMP
jgi:RNA polymerase-interacting CarD/CdnL/TRCF family regulator